MRFPCQRPPPPVQRPGGLCFHLAAPCPSPSLAQGRRQQTRCHLPLRATAETAVGNRVAVEAEPLGANFCGADGEGRSTCMAAAKNKDIPTLTSHLLQHTICGDIELVWPVAQCMLASMCVCRPGAVTGAASGRRAGAQVPHPHVRLPDEPGGLGAHGGHAGGRGVRLRGRHQRR